MLCEDCRVGHMWDGNGTIQALAIYNERVRFESLTCCIGCIVECIILVTPQNVGGNNQMLL